MRGLILVLMSNLRYLAVTLIFLVITWWLLLLTQELLRLLLVTWWLLLVTGGYCSLPFVTARSQFYFERDFTPCSNTLLFDFQHVNINFVNLNLLFCWYVLHRKQTNQRRIYDGALSRNIMSGSHFLLTKQLQLRSRRICGTASVCYYLQFL